MPKRKPGTIVTYKNGAKAKVLPNGRMRIISGPTKKAGKKKTKGGSIKVGGGVKRKRRTKKGGGFLGDVGRSVRQDFNYFVRDTLK